MRISDWSADVCSSDLPSAFSGVGLQRRADETGVAAQPGLDARLALGRTLPCIGIGPRVGGVLNSAWEGLPPGRTAGGGPPGLVHDLGCGAAGGRGARWIEGLRARIPVRSRV